MKHDTVPEHLREMNDAYHGERAKVQPPAGHRDDLMAPLNAVDKALRVADELEVKLADTIGGVREGRYSPDQADRLKERAVQDADERTTTLLGIGRNTLELLPRKLAGQVFPDEPPHGPDAADRKGDLQLWASSLDSNDPGGVADAVVRRTTEAIRSNDTTTARILMSRWGHDQIAVRIGRDAADQSWPDVRQQVLNQAAGHAEGSLRTTLVARDMVDQAERAYVAGINLVDMRITDAKQQTDQAFARMR